MASPVLTRVLSALVAALFVGAVVGAFVVDEGETNLPLGEPADVDLGLGDDDEFDYEPGEDFDPPAPTDTSIPETGITPGTGTTIASGPGTTPSPTGTTRTTAGPSAPAQPATTTTTQAGPSAPPSSGVGSTSSASDPGIYTISPDGTGLYRVVPGGTGFPTWSPDGSNIAFGVPTSTPRYMIAASDGSSRITLANGQVGSAPVFSPDGARVAFALGNGNSYDLHSVSVDGSGLRRLTTRGDVSGVAWSSTGQIAFLSGGDVWTMAADGGGTRMLVDSDRAYRAVTFSPNGGRIAWYAADQVWTANADGSQPKAAADTEGRVLEWNDITWAPDGTRLAFRSGTGGVSRVRVVGFDGTNNHVAADEAQSPDWSPGGNRLAIFTAGPVREGADRVAHLELADPDRATFRQRVLDDEPDTIQSSGPRYSRDGGRLVFATGGLDRGGPNPPGS
ncbi:MAG: hypothetical protein KY395_08475 [Actinobacteria bacterium]|nr:hypothetical protein [Actinomycetota bacterium]